MQCFDVAFPALRTEALDESDDDRSHGFLPQPVATVEWHRGR